MRSSLPSSICVKFAVRASPYSDYIHEVCKLDRARSAIKHIAMCQC